MGDRDAWYRWPRWNHVAATQTINSSSQKQTVGYDGSEADGWWGWQTVKALVDNGRRPDIRYHMVRWRSSTSQKGKVVITSTARQPELAPMSDEKSDGSMCDGTARQTVNGATERFLTPRSRRQGISVARRQAGIITASIRTRHLSPMHIIGCSAYRRTLPCGEGHRCQVRRTDRSLAATSARSPDGDQAGLKHGTSQRSPPASTASSHVNVTFIVGQTAKIVIQTTRADGAMANML